MKKSHIIIILVAIYFLTFGVVEALYRPDDIKFVHMLFNAFFAFAWCKIHASENNKKIDLRYPIFALFFPVVGLLIYLFTFFGFKIGGIKTLKIILFYIICVSLYLLPIYYI